MYLGTYYSFGVQRSLFFGKKKLVGTAFFCDITFINTLPIIMKCDRCITTMRRHLPIFFQQMSVWRSCTVESLAEILMTIPFRISRGLLA